MQRIIHIPILRQIDDIIETIKEARLSDKPIQFIVTKDIQIIDDLVSNPRLVSQVDRFIPKPPPGQKLTGSSSALQYSLGFQSNPTDAGWQLGSEISVPKPTLFVLNLFNTEKNSTDYQFLFSELKKL